MLKSNGDKATTSLRIAVADAVKALLPKALLASIKQTSGQSGQYYRWGKEDNVPNLIVEAVNDSPTARLCVSRLNQFLFGKGFKNPEMAEVNVSPNVNMEQFMRQAIEYFNYTDGFVIQHKFNKGGESARKYLIPIQYVRKRMSGDFIYRPGYGDEAGTFMYNHKNFVVPDYDTVRLMQPNEIREIIASQEERYGEQLGAFQYVYIPRVGQLYDKYPMPTHFSGLPLLNADAGLTLAENNLVSNTFKPQVVIKTSVLDRNDKDSDDLTEYDRMVEEINRLVSPDGSPVMLLESNNPDLVDVISLDTKSRMDETEKATDRIKKGVAMLFGTPAVLIGIDTAGKLGDNQEMVNKFKLFNLTLDERRKVLYQAFHHAFSNFEEDAFELEPLSLFDYVPDKVIERMTDEQVREAFDLPMVSKEGEEEQEITSRFAEFGVGGVQGILGVQQAVSEGTISITAGAEVLKVIYGFDESQAYKMLGGSTTQTQDGEVVTQGEEEQEDRKVNEHLKTLTGKQQQQIDRIVRKFNKEQLTETQAVMQLTSGFGFTEDEARAYLEIEEVLAFAQNTYSDYGEGVRNNAKRALEYAEKNGWGSCGTPVGKERANQLAKGEAISVETIKRMYSYLSRAADDYDGGSLEKCGNLMYLAWGGKSALSWSRNKLRELGEIDE